MTTHLAATMTLPAPTERVWAMLADPGYLAAKCQAPDGGSFEVVGPDGAMTVTVTRALEGEVPPMARGFLGDSIRLVERHQWEAGAGPGRTGRLDIEVAGAPATITGTMALRADGPEASSIDLNLDITVSIPLFGGRAEAMVRDELAKAIADEEALARTWLSA